MFERRILNSVLIALLALLPGRILARDIPADAPALAPRGTYSVGIKQTIWTDPERQDILKPDRHGSFVSSKRKLPLVIWYPAKPIAAKSQHVVYTMQAPFLAGLPGNSKRTLTFPGQASRDASPATGRFPVLVLSHGYNNRAIGWSHLAENLASKGYIVLAIEHSDLSPAVAGSRRASFAQVLVDRSEDQRFVITEIQRLATSTRTGLFSHVDAGELALAGYSMGGYGAIATAGAGFDPHSPIMSQIPAQLMKGSLQGDDKPIPGLKALVLFGPWGGSPATRMWASAGLAQITVPTLVIDGGSDDIADYSNGVRWLFQQMVSADRYLLTYLEARHNIAMNAAPDSVSKNYLYMDKFNEPVWRKDRILAINAHMITAFLDLHLKGIAERASYLKVSTSNADDATWPVEAGEVVGAKVAEPTGASAQYWRGFHRRWALGLKLEHLSPDKPNPRASDQVLHQKIPAMRE